MSNAPKPTTLSYLPISISNLTFVYVVCRPKMILLQSIASA